MYLGKEFQEMIYSKYQEMRESNIKEAIIDDTILGKIKIFINTKPEYSLLKLKFENDDIYIGSNKKTTE